ncbi:hypothetical protein P13BB106kb_p002 [Pectobacterium phage DU_PP_V]|uniref:Uncharacterized protein n=1 Tax=Pectobacterium phage DU_PP_V TaxID=2041492 RepID=A0A2D2W6R1_9CAUD|nr:hypothetical protein HOS40_gp002 [Pectobacterium phage DU_PP_V]ATS93986.1 hypothetical protein P13BB106kb_p002 [Pectobacterium phage DU_PP_V]
MKVLIQYRNGKRFIQSGVVDGSVIINPSFISFDTFNLDIERGKGEGIKRFSSDMREDCHTVFINPFKAQVSYVVIINQRDDSKLECDVTGRNGLEFIVVPVLDSICIDELNDSLKWLSNQ